MTRLAALAVLLAFPSLASAGLHISTEPVRPLPADWRGFLPDHRSLRLAANPRFGLSTPLRDVYADAALKLESAARTRPLTADEAADLGGLTVRLGQPAKAVEVLRSAARRFPEHFRIAANLGTAWQLSGDLGPADDALGEAVRLAPDEWKAFETAHLALVRLRLAEGRVPADAPDALFPGKRVENVAHLQRLALTFPADGRLLWLLAEAARDAGDPRTAANILDGCVTEFGMSSSTIRDRRQRYRAEAEEREKTVGHGPAGTIRFASTRPLSRTFDPAKLPPVSADGVNPLPWAALTETEIGRGFKVSVVDRVRDLDGKRVAVVGYALPTAGGLTVTESPVGCWFCEAPGPTQTLDVDLANRDADVPRGAVKVVGTLQVNRTDPERPLFAVTAATAVAAD